MTFEENMEKLQGIVDGLESGNLELLQAMKAFDEGKALVKKLDAQLGKAEAKVKVLEEEDA